jgi:hypothetical protein
MSDLKSVQPSVKPIINNNVKILNELIAKNQKQFIDILNELSCSYEYSEYFCDSVDMGFVAGNNLSVVFCFENGEDMIPATDNKVTITFYHGDKLVLEAIGVSLEEIAVIRFDSSFGLDRKLLSLTYKMMNKFS